MSDLPSPQSTASIRRAAVSVFWLTCLGTLVWISAIFLAPELRARGAGAASSFLYACFSPICHQIPERSFHLHGFPLAVCSRCLGIYAGFLAGLAFYPIGRGFSRISLPRGRLFLLLSLPIGADFAGSLLGLWESSNPIRFATGLVWGVILPYYFVTGVAELVLSRSRRKGRMSPSPNLAAGASLDHLGRKKVE
jgi:uncharacterized membrane protein